MSGPSDVGDCDQGPSVPNAALGLFESLGSDPSPDAVDNALRRAAEWPVASELDAVAREVWRGKAVWTLAASARWGSSKSAVAFGYRTWRRQMKTSGVHEVEQLFQQFVVAFNAGDLETLRSFYTEDAVIIPPGQPSVQGVDAIITQLWGPLFKAFAVDAELPVEEIQLGARFGFVRGRYRMRLNPSAGGDSVSEEGRYIDIVKADPNGAWKIARAIWNAA